MLHHLILVFVLSLKIPGTGSIFIETVKVNPAEPILSADHCSLNLSTPQISPQRSWIHSQNTRSFAECQKFFSNATSAGLSLLNQVWRDVSDFSHRMQGLPLTPLASAGASKLMKQF